MKEVKWAGTGLLAMALALVVLVHPLMAQVRGVDVRYGQEAKVVRGK